MTARVFRRSLALTALLLAAAGPAAASTPVAPSTPEPAPAAADCAPGDGTTTPGSTSGSTGSAASGETIVPAPGAGIQFAAPSEYTLVNPTQMQSVDPDKLPPAMVSAAEAAGVPIIEYLRKLAEQVDILLIGPAASGFTPNISVAVVGQGLPTDPQIQTEYQKIGASEVTIERITSPLGDTVSTTYQAVTPKLTAHGRQIFAAGPNGTVSITVTTGDAAQADHLMSRVLATLAPISAEAASPDVVEGTTAAPGTVATTPATVATLDTAAGGPTACATVSSAKAQVSVSLPGTMTVFVPSELAAMPEADLPPIVSKVAQAQGTTISAMLADLANRSDFVALEPDNGGVPGSVGISVYHDAMPTAAETKAAMEQAGTHVSVSPVTTPAGTGLLATYQIPVAGVTGYGAKVMVPDVAGQLVSVTVLSDNQATTQRLAADVVATLTPTAS